MKSVENTKWPENTHKKATSFVGFNLLCIRNGLYNKGLRGLCNNKMTKPQKKENDNKIRQIEFLQRHDNRGTKNVIVIHFEEMY